MVKRIGSAALWFLAVGWGFNYVSALTGLSPIMGLAFAAAVGAFIGVDPLHTFWPAPVASPMRRVRDAVPVPRGLQTQA